MNRNNRTTTGELTTKELIRAAVNAGASGAFAACVAVSIDGRNIAKENARKAARRDRKPAMGHFAGNLWDGNLRAAERHADTQSARLMEKANVEHVPNGNKVSF